MCAAAVSTTTLRCVVVVVVVFVGPRAAMRTGTPASVVGSHPAPHAVTCAPSRRMRCPAVAVTAAQSFNSALPRYWSAPRHRRRLRSRRPIVTAHAPVMYPS